MNLKFLGDEKWGIAVYESEIKNCAFHISNIENTASGKFLNKCLWTKAEVGLYKHDDKHRRCFDWKPTENFVDSIKQDNVNFFETFYSIKNSVYNTAQNYASRYNIQLGYMEVMNFIKYFDDDFFNYHSDDGATYLSTVSSVAYLNDDYKGGGLHFKFFDVEYTPNAGDVVVFPSTFLYSHSAMNVDAGVKYSVVTMFDYNRKEFIDTIGKNREYFA